MTAYKETSSFLLARAFSFSICPIFLSSSISARLPCLSPRCCALELFSFLFPRLAAFDTIPNPSYIVDQKFYDERRVELLAQIEEVVGLTCLPRSWALLWLADIARLEAFVEKFKKESYWEARGKLEIPFILNLLPAYIALPYGFNMSSFLYDLKYRAHKISSAGVNYKHGNPICRCFDNCLDPNGAQAKA
jgi:hypothetical protein